MTTILDELYEAFFNKDRLWERRKQLEVEENCLRTSFAALSPLLDGTQTRHHLHSIKDSSEIIDDFHSQIAFADGFRLGMLFGRYAAQAEDED